MGDQRTAFVGIDAAKMRNAIALAEAGRDGEVRYFGEVEASAESMRRVVKRISSSIREHATRAPAGAEPRQGNARQPLCGRLTADARSKIGTGRPPSVRSV